MNLKKFLIIIFSLLLVNASIGQIENSKEVLQKNKVKSQIEKLCLGSCSNQYYEFDKRGNLITFNFFRTSTIYKHIYDAKDNRIMTLWIDKNDTTQIDTLHQKDFLQTEEKAYQEEYFRNGKLLIKTSKNERYEYVYDENCSIVNERHFENNDLIYEELIGYDDLGRIVEKVTRSKERLEQINYWKDSNDKIEALLEKYKYNSKGQIIEQYIYFSDPCLGLNGHFLYKYHYFNNGLLESAEIFEAGNRKAFSLEFQYEFY